MLEGVNSKQLKDVLLDSFTFIHKLHMVYFNVLIILGNLTLAGTVECRL